MTLSSVFLIGSAVAQEVDKIDDDVQPRVAEPRFRRVEPIPPHESIPPQPTTSFEGATELELLGERPSWVAEGDLDGENGPDLLVTSAPETPNAGPERVEVFLMLDSGVFGDGQTLPIGEEVGATSAVIVDVDGDHDMDAAITLSMIDSVLLLLNDGTGEFTQDGTFAGTGEAPTHIAAGDLDADGDADLVTSNLAGGSVSVLLNDGQGTYVVQSTHLVGEQPLDVVVEDLNGDCDEDIAVAVQGSGEVVLLFNDGQGRFPSSIGASDLPFGAGMRPRGLTAADLDHDGDVDLATTSASGAPTVSGSACVLWNDGNGEFSRECYETHSPNPDALVAKDFDADGDKDLAITDSPGSRVVLLHNQDGTSFGGVAYFPVGDNPTMIAAGDFDGTGSIDIATSNGGSDDVSVLVNTMSSGADTFCETTPNALGAGAHIDTFGSLAIQEDEFTLMVRCVPPGATGIFFYGADTANLPFGQGRLCVAPPFFRLPPAVKVDENGTATRTIDFDEPPPGQGGGEIFPGSTWYFQFWYRAKADVIVDPSDRPRGAFDAFDTSDALAATFRL